MFINVFVVGPSERRVAGGWREADSSGWRKGKRKRRATAVVLPPQFGAPVGASEGWGQKVILG